MHPTLISLGSFSVSSFGLFLTLGFLAALFVIWRLCRSYDIDEEQTLDLTLITFFGGLLGARIYFVLTNPTGFDNLLKMVLINRYPGLNFWGGMIAGALTLGLLSKKLRLGFWMVADFMIVGVFAALIFGSLGCLLGSCQYGIVSSAPYAVTQVGLLNKRFPIQLLSSILYFIAFIYLWKSCLRFHFSGKIAASGLMILGAIKFFTEFLRADFTPLTSYLSLGQFFGIVLFVFGLVTIYKQGKRSAKGDLLFISGLITNTNLRKKTLLKILRSLYNSKTNIKIGLVHFRKNLIYQTKSVLRLINVKSNPPQF